ncbi:hypothetical protein AB0H73_10115 [Streptomyces olivoreticuli]
MARREATDAGTVRAALPAPPVPGGAAPAAPGRADAAGGRPTVVNRGQLAAELGIEPWMVNRGQELGIIPERTTPKGWSRQVADELADRVGELLEAIADREGLGARRLAEEILAPATGLAVAGADVPALAARGFLHITGDYSGHALYSVRDARSLTADGRLALQAVIAERLEREARREAEWQAWCAVSLPPAEAAQRLGWTPAELEKTAREGLIAAGRGGRYPTDGLEALAADEELSERITGDRLIRSDEAAGLLEIRPSDWKLVVTAGWVTPQAVDQARVGRRRWIDVPYYRARDVEALREMPGIDWEEVKSVRPGQPSPLREFIARVPDRAEAVHRFSAALADRHQVDVWAYFDNFTGIWELEWTHDGHGAPDPEDIAEQLRTDPLASRHQDAIRLGGTRWGARARWAHPLTQPGAAVVLCTRTAPAPASAGTTAGNGSRGGHGREEVLEEEVLVEIAVTDAATGEVLLETRVRTDRHSPGDGPDTGGGPAREWEKILPRLRTVTRGRLIIPADPARDRARITTATQHASKRPMHLAHPDTWALNDNEQPITGPTTHLPAREACAHVREQLHHHAHGKGHHHTPNTGPGTSTDTTHH